MNPQKQTKLVYETYTPKYSRTLCKKMVRKTIPPKREPDLVIEQEDDIVESYHCEECGNIVVATKLLMCDYNNNDTGICDRMVCLSCAQLDTIPEGEWYCLNHFFV